MASQQVEDIDNSIRVVNSKDAVWKQTACCSNLVYSFIMHFSMITNMNSSKILSTFLDSLELFLNQSHKSLSCTSSFRKCISPPSQSQALSMTMIDKVSQIVEYWLFSAPEKRCSWATFIDRMISQQFDVVLVLQVLHMYTNKPPIDFCKHVIMNYEARCIHYLYTKWISLTVQTSHEFCTCLIQRLLNESIKGTLTNELFDVIFQVMSQFCEIQNERVNVAPTKLTQQVQKVTSVLGYHDFLQWCIYFSQASKFVHNSVDVVHQFLVDTSKPQNSFHRISLT